MDQKGSASVQDATAQFIRMDRDGPVAILSLSPAPDAGGARRTGNALIPALRQAVLATLQAAQSDGSITAIVLTAGQGDFSVGQDVLGAGDTGQPPDVAALCAVIESSVKPVVVALTGVALGGGLELALAAQGRVAAASARFGLPEVLLGLSPGAGATQRLPRLIGAEQALRLMLTGQTILAPEALAMGLLDRVVEGDPVPAARDMAARLTGEPPRPTMDRRDGMRDAVAYQRAVADARAALRQGVVQVAPRIIDCVEAALLLPAAQGLAYEAATRADLAASPVAAGLRHAFVAERRAARLPARFGSVWAAQADRLMVWGADAPATQVALAALQSGMQVGLAAATRDDLVAGLERIAAAQDALLRRGDLTQTAMDAEWARLTPLLAPDHLPDADIVLLTAVDAPPLPMGAAVLALGLTPPPGAMGLVLSDRLAELALTDTVAPARAAQALAFARRIGWRAVPHEARDNTAPSVTAALARALAETVAHLEMQGVPRPDIARALAAHGIAGDGGALRPNRGDTDIARRCVAAMANAGARLIAQGVVARPCAVDTVAIGAGLMARHTGGPMFQSDRRGMLVLVRDLRRWADESPALWQPSPLIEQLWSQGRRFADLDAMP